MSEAMDQELRKCLDGNIIYEKKHLDKWVKRDINLELLQGYRQKIRVFIGDPRDLNNKRAVCGAVEDQYFYHLQHHLHHVLNGIAPEQNHLGSCALYSYWGNRMTAAMIKIPDGAGKWIQFSRAFLALAHVMTAGWDVQAYLLGHDFLAYMRQGRMDLFERQRAAQLVLKAYKLWQGIDQMFEDENTIEEMDGFGPLVQDMAHPDPLRFVVALDKAADYHIAQSFIEAENKLSAIPSSAYWLFPVELFAVLRIRQWMGLELPELTHPLFVRTPAGRFPEPVPIPRDPLLSQALPLFAQVTGTLDLDERSL